MAPAANDLEANTNGGCTGLKLSLPGQQHAENYAGAPWAHQQTSRWGLLRSDLVALLALDCWREVAQN